MFEEEICLESILRSIHKLQASVAALMQNDEDKIRDAKTMYYANQIIYRSSENEEKMKITTEYLDFLRYSLADTIYYDHDGGDGHGEFSVKAKKSGRMSHSQDGSNYSTTKLNVSLKLRKNQSSTIF